MHRPTEESHFRETQQTGKLITRESLIERRCRLRRPDEALKCRRQKRGCEGGCERREMDEEERTRVRSSP
ncbi:hypothetical protein MRX96_016310 [Rhipicephalus microplus]